MDTISNQVDLQVGVGTQRVAGIILRCGSARCTLSLTLLNRLLNITIHLNQQGVLKEIKKDGKR